MSYNFEEDTKENSFDVLTSACEALSDSEREKLLELLSLHGIHDSFINYSGERQVISLLDRWDILHLKGVNLLEGSRVSLEKLDAELSHFSVLKWKNVFPSVLVINREEHSEVLLRLPEHLLNTELRWQLIWENGDNNEGECLPSYLDECDSTIIDGITYSARRLSLPVLNLAPLGYHKLMLYGVSEELLAQTILIVAPRRCYEPNWVQDNRRIWGLSVQLYAVRGNSNWGVGDFSDLSSLVELSARSGAQFLSLNPLHALDSQRPENCSPYSPNDRRRLNYLYIDPTIEPEYKNCSEVKKKTDNSRWQNIEAKLRNKPVIDYVKVAQRKREILALMYDYFVEHDLKKSTPRAEAFKRFVESEGEPLEEFARLEVKREFPRGTSKAERDYQFVIYLQWLATLQLASCQEKARDLGMAIGLIGDLAVGSSAGGGELSQNLELFSLQTSIGAPPDPLAPQGQNWGLPPMDPVQLQETAYAHFVELLRCNMSHYGALRIDHIMALMRLWWCPRFPGRGTGAYVGYPVADLFAILRLESQRNKCVVIGEDLGVVPPEIRGHLESSGIFSNILFYFEKYDGHHFKKPEHYKAKALMMVANHDVPTVAAWWNGADLRLRRNLDLITSDEDLANQLNHRNEERKQVLHLLHDQWLAPEGRTLDRVADCMDSALCAAIFRLCARSSSQLVSVQLEDLSLQELPVNIPGTSSEYPNWQRKLTCSTHELFSIAAREKLLEGFAIERS